jgi:hypothetical protein
MMTLYVYDTGFGQGIVEAKSKDEARRLAIREAGSFAYRGGLKEASKADLDWHEAMGGTAS